SRLNPASRRASSGKARKSSRLDPRKCSGLRVTDTPRLYMFFRHHTNICITIVAGMQLASRSNFLLWGKMRTATNACERRQTADCYPLRIGQELHLTCGVVAGNLTGNSNWRLSNLLNPLQKPLEFESSPDLRSRGDRADAGC